MKTLFLPAEVETKITAEAFPVLQAELNEHKLRKPAAVWTL